ncbi:MAG: hypothetical protein EBX50_16505 [Chitinophagia bacterium]|nr:hypothetical protein [Chitinophagia bacterium]
MLKRQTTQQTMTENELNIQTILTKRTDFQADRVLLFGQVSEKKEQAIPSHFLKFLLISPHCTHMVLLDIQADPSQNQKSIIFANLLATSIL